MLSINGTEDHYLLMAVANRSLNIGVCSRQSLVWLICLGEPEEDIGRRQKKTLLSEQPPSGESQQPSDGGRRGRLKEKIIEKKTGEFKDMMDGIASLVARSQRLTTWAGS